MKPEEKLEEKIVIWKFQKLFLDFSEYQFPRQKKQNQKFVKCTFPQVPGIQDTDEDGRNQISSFVEIGF